MVRRLTRSSVSSATRLRSVTDANRCFLGTEEQLVVSSILRRFPEDVAAFLEGRPTSTRLVHVPLITDIDADGNGRTTTRITPTGR